MRLASGTRWSLGSVRKHTSVPTGINRRFTLVLVRVAERQFPSVVEYKALERLEHAGLLLRKVAHGGLETVEV